MLTTLMTAAALTGASPSADLMAAERDALKALSWMDGEWRGTAVTRTATGEHHVLHTERIGTLLSGTVRLVEGHSYREDGSTGFNAFGMIRYDPITQSFHMASHAEGRFGDYVLEPLADGYRWSIPAGPATIEYRATVADGVWTETGQRVVAGQAPQPFFKMELKRIGDSAWPAGSPVGAK